YPVCDRVCDYQESSRSNEGWSRLCGRNVPADGAGNMGIGELLYVEVHGWRRKFLQQQDVFDWHRRRLRHSNAVERLGNYLAEQQTHHCRDRWNRSGRSTRTRATGVSGFQNKRMALAATAVLHGHGTRRLGDPRREVTIKPPIHAEERRF